MDGRKTITKPFKMHNDGTVGGGREEKREKTIVVSASEAQLITPDQVTKSNWQRGKRSLAKKTSREREEIIIKTAAGKGQEGRGK